MPENERLKWTQTIRLGVCIVGAILILYEYEKEKETGMPLAAFGAGMSSLGMLLALTGRS